jgi:hypothetical protein
MAGQRCRREVPTGAITSRERGVYASWPPCPRVHLCLTSCDRPLSLTPELFFPHLLLPDEAWAALGTLRSQYRITRVHGKLRQLLPSG